MAPPSPRYALQIGLLAALWFGRPALADTSCPASRQALAASMAEARSRLALGEIDAFWRGWRASSAALACVDAPLRPEEAAAYHWLAAGALSLEGGPPGRGPAALRAAIDADPNTDVPDAFPPGDPMRAWFEAAWTLPGAAEVSLPALRVGCRFLVDGRPARAVSGGRPAVLQVARLGADGRPSEILWTGHRWSDEPTDALRDALPPGCRPIKQEIP